MPEPLTSRLHPVWEHPTEILRLAKALRLGLGELARARVAYGPLAAFEVLSQAYVTLHGRSPAIPMFTFGMVARQRHNMHAEPLTPTQWEWIAEMERKHSIGPTDAMIADKLAEGFAGTA